MSDQPIVPTDSVRILARRSDEFQNTFLISKSLPTGTILTDGPYLVGFVNETASRASRASLVSAPFIEVQGYFEVSGIPAEFTGRGAGILEARIPRGNDVQVGELVFHDEGFRLVIGEVVHIRDVASDPFLTITILQQTNITTLTHVTYLPWESLFLQ